MREYPSTQGRPSSPEQNLGPRCNGLDPNRSVFTDFLDTLNNKCNLEETTVCKQNADCPKSDKCGYAGYRDWRLPNVKAGERNVGVGV